MKKNKNRRHVGNKRYFWAMQPAPERLTLCWRRRMRQKSMELIFWQHRMLQNQAAGTESIWTRKAIADLQKQSMKDLQDKEMRRSRYRERTDSFLRNNKRKSTKTILTKENKLCTIYLSKKIAHNLI